MSLNTKETKEILGCVFNIRNWSASMQSFSHIDRYKINLKKEYLESF